MSRAALRAALACVLTLAVAGVGHAQSSQADANAQKPKKNVNQVPETGQDDPAPPDRIFDRVPANVPITVRADGTIVAELDDTFMEAQTATVEADGSLRFDHVTGLARAAALVRAQRPTASTQLPSRALPLAYPIYEVK